MSDDAVVSGVFPDLVESRAVVLRLENVDTDVVTPIARVLEGPDAIVRYAFEPLRFDDAGSQRRDDPFADPERAGAAVLVAGRNFGCGSSRETAAMAVRGLGFRVVVAPSYGDIFYSNCLKNGVLAIRLAADLVERIMVAADRLAPIRVDLAAQRLSTDDVETGFEIGTLQKEMLMSGHDEIGLMQARKNAHADWNERDAAMRPWVRHRRRAV